MTSRTDLPAAKTTPDLVELSIAVVSGLALVLTAIFICAAPLSGQIAGARDFVVYWATGQQLVHHASPYDREAMTRIERAAKLPAMYGVGFMRNPPWGLPLTLPLGLIGVRVATLLWSLILLACLLGSVHMLWRLHGSPGNYLHWLGLSFAPALICLIAGQTALFALVGLVLFLRLHRTRPFLAGMSLWLCALKPHLFVPFGVVLLAWVIVSRSYRLLAGAAVAMAASCAAVYCVDPTAWTDYAQMMRTSGIEKEFIPCLSIVLRLRVSPQTMWLQYLPVALACVWALGYFWPRRHAWDWTKDGSLLMLVSIVLAPYCWLFDQALAIPALLQGAYITRSRMLLAALAVASIVLWLEAATGFKLTSALHLWTAPAWLAWYLLAGASAKREPAGQPASV
jgi:hypothetical protein